jgi:hypothetical protein
MKITLLFALVLALAAALAVPAFAFKIEGAQDTNFYFGALILTDVGAWNRNKELMVTNKAGTSERTEYIMNLSKNSRVRGSLEVGQVGGYFELRLAGDRESPQFPNGVFSGGAYFMESAKLYGWYKFGNCQILAGKTDGHVYSVVPYQVLGKLTNDHNAGYGWGAINDQKDTQVRFSQDITKMVGYDISLVQTQYYTDQTIQSYATFPLVAAKVRLNFGVVSLMPAGYVQYVKWDNLPAIAGQAQDDNMTSWFTVLPVVVKAGAFTGTIQVGYGQNTTSPLSGQSAFHQYQRLAGKVKNTTSLNGFVDLAYAVGPITPHVYYGYDKAENTDVYVGDKYNVRQMYGVSANWKIADSFYLVPEFTYYDWGKDAKTKGNPDIGKEWLAGVEFQFVF